MRKSASGALARLVVGRPKTTLAVALAITFCATPLIARLRLDTDIVDLFPHRSREAQAFARFSRSFVAERVLLALIEGDDPERLTKFTDAYAAALSSLPEVAEVRYRLSAGAGAFMRQHLLQLLTDEEIAVLRQRATPEALKIQASRLRGLLSAPGGSQLAPLFTTDPLELLPLIGKRLSHGLPVDTQSGYFKGADGRAMLLFVRPKAGALDVEADRALISAATAKAKALSAKITDGDYRGGPTPEVGFSGACAYTLYYRDWLHRDTTLSTALSAIAVLVLFGLFFRALRVLLLVAAPLLTGLAWTGALAAALFGQVNAVSLAFGTILLSIGIDLPIQLYNRLREQLTMHASPKDALGATIEDLTAPSITATLAPAAVFFSCALSSYRGLGELGILAGLGLIVNLVAMLTVFPALLAALPTSWWARPPRAARGNGLLEGLGRMAGRHPTRILGIAALGAVLAIPLAMRARFDRRLIAHPEAMPPVRVEAEVERRFGERDRAVIVLNENPDPEIALEQADQWLKTAERLRERGLLKGYQSISALLPSKQAQRERAALLAALDPPRIARDLRTALEQAGFDPAPFADFLGQLERPPAPIQKSEIASGELDFLLRAHVLEGGRSVATYLYPADGKEDAALLALGTAAAGPGDGTITGKPVLERVLRQLAERDTKVVTLVSTLAVALLLFAYYRRWRPFVAVMVPLGLAWVLFGAALGAFDLPLNLFNLLAVPLVIGYGIDDHVYLVHRHMRDPSGGPGRTLKTTGRAIVLTSLSTIAGFLPLGVARFPGLRLLGLSGALAVALCLCAAFLVLPAMLELFWPHGEG
jgi:predicted RND superfamily exporter protein